MIEFKAAKLFERFQSFKEVRLQQKTSRGGEKGRETREGKLTASSCQCPLSPNATRLGHAATMMWTWDIVNGPLAPWNSSSRRVSLQRKSGPKMFRMSVGRAPPSSRLRENGDAERQRAGSGRHQCFRAADIRKGEFCVMPLTMSTQDTFVSMQ